MDMEIDRLVGFVIQNIQKLKIFKKLKIKKKNSTFQKLVKPQVSEAVAIPLIYADIIQHKGLFKYYITHFWMILDSHPPPVKV